MLTTVKEYISQLPDISFEQYYVSYIMMVQDVNIALELKSFKGKGLSSIKQLEMAIINDVERVKNDIFM